MFTLEDINAERTNYMSYFKNEIPMIAEVKYDLAGDTNGQILANEIDLENIVLHLNSKIFKYHKRYQTAIIWHEFTHIFDEMNYPCPKNMKSSYMKTFSEVNAIENECRYLLAMKPYEDMLYDVSKKIYFLNYHKDFNSIMNYYNSVSKRNFYEVLKNGNPLIFNSAFNNLMYLCGAVKITYYDKSYIIDLLNDYPPIIKNDLISLIDKIYNNEFIQVCIEYESLKIKIIEFSLRKTL